MKKKWSPFLSHLTGWILFLSLPVLFVAGQHGGQSIVQVLVSPVTWLFSLTYIVIFYLHTYLLIPLLYMQRKFIAYVFTVLLLLTAIYFIRPFDRMVKEVSTTNELRQGPPPPRFEDDFPPADRIPPPGPGNDRPSVDVVSIFLLLMILALSMTIRVRQRLRWTEQRALKAEADKANAELSFLKAQINPHFLFNTLNNIYSLAVTRSDNTADSIMKLSNIMRYVTDDAHEDFVGLESEVGCISDYIDLQRLRLGPATQVDFTVNGNPEGKKIAPLVLMTFVENVFKYGISNHEASGITISLQTDEKSIQFICRNKLFDIKRNTESTGIGIENTRQRLIHLYPDRHSLSIKKENGYFTVKLILYS